MVTKKALRALHKAIRHQDIECARRMLIDTPELVNAPASAPPKKDDGQSPLQIALKCGQFEIADLLIEKGADVRFMETSNINEWRMPVLHDALRATVFSMRSAWATHGNAERLRAGIGILTKILQGGADPNGIDSYGNHCFQRVMLDLRQVWTINGFEDSNVTKRDPVFDEDARRIVGVLIEYGGDVHLATETRQSAVEYSRGRYFEKIIHQASINKAE